MELCRTQRQWVGLGFDRAAHQAPSAEARGHSRSQLARATDLALPLGSRPIVKYGSREKKQVSNKYNKTIIKGSQMAKHDPKP
jgi:hypothetical protein